MIEYKFGDRVDHPEYGRCIFVAYNEPNKSFASVVDTGNDWIKHVNAADLTPADPRIIKINGVWHRVYTPLDGEEAHKVIGKGVRFGNDVEDLAGYETAILERVEGDGEILPYKLEAVNAQWGFIALPIETPAPEKKPERDYEKTTAGLLLRGQYAEAVCKLMGIGEEAKG